MARILRLIIFWSIPLLRYSNNVVTSKLDNLNALLINTPSFQMQQLQLIQNTAARIVTQERRFCNITPILKDHHFLPVAARIEFKVRLT